MPAKPASSLAAVRAQFRAPDLFDRALTHRSASGNNNERLEFLGDAVLNFLVAEALYRSDPTAHEGALTRRRASLVRRETLSKIAKELSLGEELHLGAGELKSGGRDRDSILADAVEALIGALYLDRGLDPCRDWVATLLAPRLRDATHHEVIKDPKTRLQELLQSKGLPLPVYEVVRLDGAAHEQTFVVSCTVPGLASPVRGNGSSRRKAEQAAAGAVVELIEARPQWGRAR